MNFFKKKKEKINCFFCNIEVDKHDAFVLQYNTRDGMFDIQICKMCEGMLADIMKVYKDD